MHIHFWDIESVLCKDIVPFSEGPLLEVPLYYYYCYYYYYYCYYYYLFRMRRIVLPWGKLGDDISILGGRGRGIFFHTQRIDSKGLKSGDQLIKVLKIYSARDPSTLLIQPLLLVPLEAGFHHASSPHGIINAPPFWRYSR